MQASIDDLDPAVTAGFHLRADGQLAVGFLQQDPKPFQKDLVGVWALLDAGGRGRSKRCEGESQVAPPSPDCAAHSSFLNALGMSCMRLDPGEGPPAFLLGVSMTAGVPAGSLPKYFLHYSMHKAWLAL